MTPVRLSAAGRASLDALAAEASDRTGRKVPRSEVHRNALAVALATPALRRAVLAMSNPTKEK